MRASDCSGLIYSYFCWVDDNSNIQPNWNYPRTVTAQANDAVESGPIDTIPRTHGLIVTIANYDHVGVYVGNGMVVDNSTWGVNMRYESIPGHGWLQWHKLGSITYPTTGWYKFDGDYFYYENGEYVINTTRTINGVTYTFGSDGVSDKTPSSANGSFSEADSAFNAKTTAGVRLRKGPGLSYDTITVLAEGTKVNVTSTKNSEWYAVTTASGQKGYVFSEYLNVTGTVNEDDSSDSGSSDNSNTGTNGEAAKTTTGVHLRSGKGTNYSSLGVIPGGTAITVTDKSDMWYAVTVNGKSGYMYSEYIKLTGTDSSDNNTSSGSTDGSAFRADERRRTPARRPRHKLPLPRRYRKRYGHHRDGHKRERLVRRDRERQERLYVQRIYHNERQQFRQHGQLRFFRYDAHHSVS